MDFEGNIFAAYCLHNIQRNENRTAQVEFFGRLLSLSQSCLRSKIVAKPDWLFQ